MTNDYTFSLDSICAGGEHMTISIYKNGQPYRTKTMSREEIKKAGDLAWADVIPFFIAKILLSANSVTDEEHRQAISSAVITL